jgi:HSP20 family protein
VTNVLLLRSYKKYFCIVKLFKTIKKNIMETRALTRLSERMPSLFGDLFRPWSDLFGNGDWPMPTMNVPAVNISEQDNRYLVSLAAPGMKKDDFKIEVDGNMLTITSEKEESTEEKDKKFTRKEYNYSSFSRCFSLPEEVKQENIEAKYEDGVLKIALPRKEESKKPAVKKIAVK